jgi:RNA polymerase sigma factor (sigma-70 family)
LVLSQLIAFKPAKQGRSNLVVLKRKFRQLGLSLSATAVLSQLIRNYFPLPTNHFDCSCVYGIDLSLNKRLTPRMSNSDLQLLISGCRNSDRFSQKRVYQQFYNYSMNVANRYARNEEEGEEIVNDSFVKIFTKIHQYNSDLSFLGWLHRIVVNTAISYLRKYDASFQTDNVDLGLSVEVHDSVINKLSADEILMMVQQLPASYRVAFNLYVVEGYQHNEIAEMLGISEGTSKSNLSIARKKLKDMVERSRDIALRRF